LQATLGGNLHQQLQPVSAASGRSTSRAKGADRRDVSSLWQIYIRNKFGAAVAIALDRQTLGFVVGPQVITRYNNYPRNSDTREPVSQALPPARRWRPWAEISAKTLPLRLWL